MRALSLAAFALVLAACQPAAAPVSLPVAPPAEEEMRRLADTQDLIRITNAIDEAVDRKAWAEARTFFADQVDVDFSSLGAPASRIAAEQLVGAWETSLGPGKPSFHLRGSHIVYWEGETARVVSQGYAWNRLLSRPAGQDLWEVWGSYEHRFARTPQGWRVTAMSFRATHQRGDPTVRSAVEPTPPTPAMR